MGGRGEWEMGWRKNRWGDWEYRREGEGSLILSLNLNLILFCYSSFSSNIPTFS
jgi:hypothetical protein